MITRRMDLTRHMSSYAVDVQRTPSSLALPHARAGSSTVRRSAVEIIVNRIVDRSSPRAVDQAKMQPGCAVAVPVRIARTAAAATMVATRSVKSERPVWYSVLRCLLLWRQFDECGPPHDTRRCTCFEVEQQRVIRNNILFDPRLRKEESPPAPGCSVYVAR